MNNDDPYDRRDFVIGVALTLVLMAAAAWFARDRIASKFENKVEANR